MMRLHSLVFFSLAMISCSYAGAMDGDGDNKKPEDNIPPMDEKKSDDTLSPISSRLKYAYAALRSGNIDTALAAGKVAHDVLLNTPVVGNALRDIHASMYQTIVARCGERTAYHSTSIVEGALSGLVVHSYAPWLISKVYQTFNIKREEKTPGAPAWTSGDYLRVGAGVVAGVGAHYAWEAMSNLIYSKEERQAQKEAEIRAQEKKQQERDISISFNGIELYDENSLSRLGNYSGKTILTMAAYVALTLCIPQSMG
jgi:hypothetical protein